MAQSRSNKYDIYTTCPICGQAISWINGSTNNGIIYVKTRRKTVNIYHEKCLESEFGHVVDVEWIKIGK